MHRFDIFLEGNLLGQALHHYESQPVKISPAPFCFAEINKIVSRQKTV
jgi:hypothetical protein